MNTRAKMCTRAVDRRQKSVYNKNQRVSIMCPLCKRPTNVKVIRGVTTLERFPLWCQKCKQETVVSYGGLSQSQRARAD